jgi:RNA polymerase sigma-70 factor (ECF subfamily)
LYRFALTLTRNRAAAEDLVQETYARALAARHKASPHESLRSWQFVILHNAWRNERRQRRPLAEPDEVERLASGDDLGSALDRRAARARLHEAFASLPDPFRQVVVLRYVEELSYKDIARVLDCPAGTVMSRLARARALLRGALGPVAVPAPPREASR